MVVVVKDGLEFGLAHLAASSFERHLFFLGEVQIRSKFDSTAAPVRSKTIILSFSVSFVSLFFVIFSFVFSCVSILFYFLGFCLLF